MKYHHDDDCLALEFRETKHFSLQVPYVLLDTLANHLTPWTKPSTSRSGTVVHLGDVSVSLTYKPLGLEVKRGKDVLLTFNSRKLFQMEHLREKQVFTNTIPHLPTFPFSSLLP